MNLTFGHKHTEFQPKHSVAKRGSCLMQFQNRFVVFIPPDDLSAPHVFQDQVNLIARGIVYDLT